MTELPTTLLGTDDSTPLGLRFQRKVSEPQSESGLLHTELVMAVDSAWVWQLLRNE